MGAKPPAKPVLERLCCVLKKLCNFSLLLPSATLYLCCARSELLFFFLFSVCLSSLISWRAHNVEKRPEKIYVRQRSFTHTQYCALMYEGKDKRMDSSCSEMTNDLALRFQKYFGPKGLVDLQIHFPR